MISLQNLQDMHCVSSGYKYRLLVSNNGSSLVDTETDAPRNLQDLLIQTGIHINMYISREVQIIGFESLLTEMTESTICGKYGIRSINGCPVETGYNNIVGSRKHVLIPGVFL